ncbi:prolyl-tRNA synthetase [Nadsonia fulvescens var. elongata DSM 6958]|uniref:proline--tRNA ligase n=1 Tax=Nadsonia fulvescens var. elongata DSM 6958 TaxID=857566 RepID=A0A1E3PGM6_9ASCO|nr:prolyl-tRNA synthetase [Nadsonia fulvescens var. elongata DSM 6958]
MNALRSTRGFAAKIVVPKRSYNIDRLSKVYIPSGGKIASKEDTSNDLLTRAGYIRSSHSGLTQMLPLGLMVQKNIENLVHKHMKLIGGSEVSLCLLSPAELWQKTGRFDNDEVFKLQDFHGSGYVLSPTHEEEITNLIKSDVVSYRSLPVRTYQIGRKFRDEKRPRGGLLRGKEFIMKDMYTFDRTKEEALKTYDNVVDAYNELFHEIGVRFVQAQAHSGDIGGNKSHEFHFLNDHGSDTILTCTNLDDCGYAANIEVAKPGIDEKNRVHFDESAGDHIEFSVSKDGLTLYEIYIPRNRSFNRLSLNTDIFPDIDPTMNSSKQALHKYKTSESQGANVEKQTIRVIDSHIEMTSVAFNGSPITIINATLAIPNDPCPVCATSHLQESNAIEIGHTFYLGTKYSKPLSATYVPPSGKSAIDIEMGCFGIGITRLIAAITEAKRDSAGLVWPRIIAPWEIVLIAKNNVFKDLDGGADKLGKELTNKLQKQGLRVVFDDREDKSLGWKLKDSKLLGFPVTIIVNENYLTNGTVEVQWRESGEKESIVLVDENGNVNEKLLNF